MFTDNRPSNMTGDSVIIDQDAVPVSAQKRQRPDGGSTASTEWMPEDLDVVMAGLNFVDTRR
jgi:hypothetical protein